MAAATSQSDEGGGAAKSLMLPGHSQAVSSPWSSIVHAPPVMISDGPEPRGSSDVEGHVGNFTSDLCPEIVSSPDDSDGGSNASKKPVWNKRSNGVVEAVSPVMGAISWPALGESTMASPKSSSSESLKALADGALLPALQMVTGNSSPSSHKKTTANKVHPTLTPNHVAPSRQRSMKRGSGSLNSNGGVSHMSATSQDLVGGNSFNTSRKSSTAAPVESLPRENTHIESQNGSFGSQSHNGNDHQHQRNSYRRSNSWQNSRGDSSYNHGYGGKRDQDREWNQHSRSFNGRDTHLHPHRGYPRGYIRPSVHTFPPFIPPQMPLVRPFGNNMIYPDLPSPVFYVQGPPPLPESHRAMPPHVGPIPFSMYFGVPNPMLNARILSQIDYYFSNENLVTDTYLRENMDGQGWVPVSLIAGFKKVLYLTDNIQQILDTLRASTIVEIKGDKIRRRNDWMKWLMQPPQYSDFGRSTNEDELATRFQGVKLSNQGGSDGRPSSGELNSQLRQSGHIGGRLGEQH